MIVVGKERRADDQMLFQTATHDFIFVASWISETLETKEKDLKIRTISMCMMGTLQTHSYEGERKGTWRLS